MIIVPVSVMQWRALLDKPLETRVKFMLMLALSEP